VVLNFETTGGDRYIEKQAESARKPFRGSGHGAGMVLLCCFGGLRGKCGVMKEQEEATPDESTSMRTWSSTTGLVPKWKMKTFNEYCRCL
jgi:hypothetical protein